MVVSTRIVFLLALAMGCAALSAAECDPMFVVRNNDEIVLKDGTVLKGKVAEKDGGGYTIRLTTGAVQDIRADEVREIRKRATAVSELARLTTEHANNPAKLLCVFTEATTRFNLQAKVLPILERVTATQSDEGLLLFLGRMYLEAGQPDKALRIADKLLAVPGPVKPRNLMLHGQALAAQDKIEDAEKDLVKAYKAATQDMQIVLAYANLLLRSGRVDDAKKIYTDCIAISPRNIAALTGLGYVQIRSGDFPTAETTFASALAINDKYVDAKVGQGFAQLLNKRYDDAFTTAVTILNMDTKSPEAYALQAYSLIFKGDPASMAKVESKNYITDSLELKPLQPRLQLATAVMLDRQARYEELGATKDNAGAGAQKKLAAQAKFNEVLACDAPDSYIQYYIGERRFREAEDAKRRNDTVAYDTALGKAEDAYRRAQKLSPAYAPVSGALAATLMRRRKWDDARAAFAKAAEIDPKSPAAADYFAGQGLSLLNAQKFEEAQKLFSKALELDPNNSASYCGRGYIANWEKDKHRAIENFQKALAADGDCVYAAGALQQIDKQEDKEMEYVRFPGPDVPPGWKAYTPGQIKFSMREGQGIFSGVQGLAQGTRVELIRTFQGANKFERLEADLTIVPTCTASFGLRMASGGGANAAFEFDFGKDESGDLKFRVKDGQNMTGVWTATGKEWPKSGHARLGIEADGIVGPECLCKLVLNGAPIGSVKLNFQQAPKTLTMGVFVIAPPKETVNATVNNIVTVKKGVTASDKENQNDTKFIAEPAHDEKKPEEKKPDEKKPDAK